MKQKAKEMQQQRREANRRGGRPVGFGGGFGSASMGDNASTFIDNTPMDIPKPSYSAPR